MIRSLILIGLYCISVYASCNKSIFCNQNTYIFQANIMASPGTDSIQLQDTLWFTIDESTQLRNLNTNSVINFSNAANLSFVFGINKVISATTILPSADSFSYFIKKGINVQPLNPALIREFKLDEEASRYKLEVGFIPLKRGVYRVLVESSANVYTRDKPCDKASFAIRFTNADQHFYLGYNIYGDGVYYFKVY